MNGDTCSVKAPKECSKKFAATFKGKFLTRGNVLRRFFLFLEDLGRLYTIRHENITYPKKNIFELFSDYRFTISISSN